MHQPDPSLRVLFLADSHLGFDLPSRPRVDRRRRGYDFLSNHQEALAAAMRESVDLVIHGGDLFHRPRVPPSLVYQALRPLLEIAEAGVPVFVVPGNHERSRIPHDRFAAHPNLHIFRQPGTRQLDLRGFRVGVSGFPYERRRVRHRFPDLLRETEWQRDDADLRLLCIHHCVEGATVGPGNYTFRRAPDVIRCADLPAEFAAVLSGHIHRHQVLRRDLQGRPLSTPVLYPGSVERTAFAEMGEEKGFLLLTLTPGGNGGRLEAARFVGLPDRPMIVRDIRPPGGPFRAWEAGDLEAALERTIAEAPADAVLRIRIHGPVPSPLRPSLGAAALRRSAPPEMNLEVILVVDGPVHRSRPSRRQPDSAQHFLALTSLLE